MYITFKISDKKDKLRGEEEGKEKKKRRKDKPVVSEEYRVLLRVREHVPKEVSRYGIWTTSQGYGFFHNREGGRIDPDNVEINFL